MASLEASSEESSSITIGDFVTGLRGPCRANCDPLPIDEQALRKCSSKCRLDTAPQTSIHLQEHSQQSALRNASRWDKSLTSLYNTAMRWHRLGC